MPPIVLALVVALAGPGEPAAARCDLGFPADCRDLGRAHLAGVAGRRDDRLAAAALTRACEMGDPAGCADLGVLYAVGRGLPQSDDRAVALSRRACDQGNGLACSNLGALLAEGVAPAAGNEGPAAVRLFRKACDAGLSEGCTNLGAALEAGRLTLRDVDAGARALRRACDGGLGLACFRLAGLVRASPGAAPGLDARELAARACRGGVGAACAARGSGPPAGAPAAAARLVADPRTYVLGIPGAGAFTPGELAPRTAGARRRALGELRRAPAAFVAAVPEPARVRLGLGGPSPAPAPAPPPSDPAITSLLAFRRGQLLGCYEAVRAVPSERAEVFAVLFVDGDGRAADVRAASLPADSPLEGCVREVIEAWEFPASDEGYAGPFLIRQAFDAAPGPAPAYAGPGTLRPALRDPGCVERALRVPPELQGGAGAVAVKLAVDAAGRPGLVHALAPAPDALVAAVDVAVRACPWSAGGDGDGRPVPLWTTLTVRISGK
jgi:hypothetical protein